MRDRIAVLGTGERVDEYPDPEPFRTAVATINGRRVARARGRPPPR